MTTTCPFCGAALQDGWSQGDSPWYQCDTVIHGGRMHPRRGQTIRCIESEVALLTKERDEARTEVARLKTGGCARDQRTTQFCAEAVALQERVRRLENVIQKLINIPNECHCQLSNESLDAWDSASEALKAKEAKP